jgi:cytochrome c oxidase subunit 4
MSNDHSVDIGKHVRTYMVVFATLLFLTVVTVGVSYLHMSIGAAIVLALIIATIKGSLVACYFMHLISERKLIYAVLLLTAVFFVALLFLPFMTSVDVKIGG